jgi:hypothetical protein
MNAEVRFWGVAALIVFGSYGWGHVALRTLDRGRASGSLRKESSPPMVVCVGLERSALRVRYHASRGVLQVAESCERRTGTPLRAGVACTLTMKAGGERTSTLRS